MSPVAPAEPIGADEGRDLIADALDGTCGSIAVAVSGGSDSMALLYLADAWARDQGRPLHVLTVDHGLRAASCGEAAAVAAVAIGLGHQHRTLPWRGPKPRTGVQAAARDARRALLTAACLQAGISAILLGHHRDDQVETVLHRIDRETGPQGLAGMGRRVWHGGVLLVRPLLDVPKTRLQATCRAADLAFIEDPSNHDPRFARTRMRALRTALDEVGLTADRLTRLATAMGAARRALDWSVADWGDRHGVLHPCSSMTVARTALLQAPRVLRAAILADALRRVGGGGYPARARAMENLMDWIASPGGGACRTLGGCVLGVDGDAVHLVREVAACAPSVTVSPRSTAAWDGRFLVRNRGDRPILIGACGEAGWRRLRVSAGIDRRISRFGRLSHAARLAWPLVTDLDGVSMVPHLVTGERGAPNQSEATVDLHLLEMRERAAWNPLANGRLKT